MQSFRPFRATVYRHQKYYTQRHKSRQPKTPVFNLPKQIIPQKSLTLINPQILKNVPDPEHKIATDYTSNLKKTMKKQSLDLINKRALQRAASTFVQMDTIPRQMNEMMLRNKSSEMFPDKNMAFRTLNILYRTIIQTKFRNKKKESFELSAKRLPIIEKGSTQQVAHIKSKKDQTQHSNTIKHSSFDKYKLNLTTITGNSIGRDGQKYNNISFQKSDQNIYKSSSSVYKSSGQQIYKKMQQKDGFKGHYIRRSRLKMQNGQKITNQIVPWNMFQTDQGGMDMYQ